MDKVKEPNEYTVYLNMVQEYLKAAKKRLLTEKEEEIVVDHLKVVAATYCSKHSNKKNDAVFCLGLGIIQVLSIETAKKVCELHEAFFKSMSKQVNQRVEEVLVEYLVKKIREYGSIVFLPSKLTVEEEVLCSYPDLRKNAECQACNIGGCELDYRSRVIDPVFLKVDEYLDSIRTTSKMLPKKKKWFKIIFTYVRKVFSWLWNLGL